MSTHNGEPPKRGSHRSQARGSQSEFSPIGKLLVSRLNELGIHQNAFATLAMGVAPGTLTNWIYGAHDKYPDDENLSRMIHLRLEPTTFPHLSEPLPFLESQHVHDLLHLHLKTKNLAPEWPISIVNEQSMDEASKLLVLMRAESAWFRFLADQQQSLLSQFGGYLGRTKSSKGQTTPLSQMGRDFLLTLLSQFKRFAPIYMSGSASSENGKWRVAILTPCSTKPYLLIKWQEGLSTASELRNRFYIGPDPDRQETESGMAGWVYINRTPLWCPSDVIHHPKYLDCYKGAREEADIEYTSVLELPISTPPDPQSQGHSMRLGVLSVDSDSYAFTERDVELVKPFATLIALCIHVAGIDFQSTWK